jgi:hypothetical protein
MKKMMKTVLIATLLLIVGGMLVAPVSAVTTEVTTIKYAANNYSYAESSATRTWTQMQSSFTNVDSKGPVYMQGPTFNTSDPYGDAGENMILYYEHNGTYVRNLTDLVGGMSAGDEIAVKASDGMTRYFNYTNVYTPMDRQGQMVLAWWDNQSGAVPTYSEGIRFFIYTPPASSGVSDSLNLTLRDMFYSMAPWYRYNYSGIWPSAKGLSVKYVNQLSIYPPHRHDFNTTGDTTGAAFGNQTGSSPGVGDPSTGFTSTSAIADDDGIFQTDQTTTNTYYAAHRFNFSIDTSTAKDGPVADIEKLNVTWNGKGWHNTGGTANGTYLYIWNGTGYEELANNNGDGNEVYLTKEKTSGISNYVNSSNVTILVRQKSPQTTRPDKYSHIETDYVKLVVTHHHHN